LIYIHIFFIYLNIQKENLLSKLSLIKRKEKVINKKLGKAKKKSYIGRNIKNEKKCIKT